MCSVWLLDINRELMKNIRQINIFFKYTSPLIASFTEILAVSSSTDII